MRHINQRLSGNYAGPFVFRGNIWGNKTSFFGLIFVALGIGGFSLYTVVFLCALELGEPTEFDRYVDEVGVWCREHMPDARLERIH